MYQAHLTKLVFRASLLVVALILAMFKENLLLEILNYKFFHLRAFHVIWAIIMLVTAKSLFPGLSSKIGPGKVFARNYSESTVRTPSRKEKLKEYTRRMNIGAVRSAALWSTLLLIMGASYYLRILNKTSLFVIVIFFYFLDALFMQVWCPFGTWLIKDKCCNVCRIYNWGYIMVFSPLIFVPAFWTYSILLLSVVVLVQWEYLHHKHPERFYELYNSNLMCKHCRVKCRL